MFESYLLTTDGKEYIDANSVREALGIVDEYVDILGVIKKLREEKDAKIDGLKADLEHINRLYKENRVFVDKVCEAVDIQRPYLESSYDNAVKLISEIKRERDELKEKCDKLKERTNAMYGASCGYSASNQPAFRCNVISYSWEFGSMLDSDPVHVKIELALDANHDGSYDLEDLFRYIQEYSREKKLGILESVDYQKAKAARAELAFLYKTVLGKEKIDRDLSPHEVMKAILDEYKRRKEFLRELSCSLGFGDPVVTRNDIDQKEKDILERIEGLKAGVWPCENSSTFAEYLKKEFPELCKEYNVAPLTEGGSVRDWINYIFEDLTDYRELANINFRKAEGFRKDKHALTNSLAELRAKVREIYRSVVDDEWDESLSYASALNDINEEYKRVVHEFEKATDNWSNMSLQEFRDNVCEIFDIPSSNEYKRIIKELHNIVDRYDKLEDFRSDICDALDTTTAVSDSYLFKNIEKLKLDHKEIQEKYSRYCLAVGSLCGIPAEHREDISWIEDSFNYTKKEYLKWQTTADKLARLRSNICTALCLGCETSDEDILERIRKTRERHDKFRKNAIEDLKNRGFFFRPEENETLPEIYSKLLKRYDDYFGRYKEQYRLRQCWHVRWESENERANGVQKALDREREKCRVKDISLETAKKQYEKVCGNLETAECALNGMKSKVRELREENALLKKDIAELKGEENDGTANTDD